VQLPRIGPRAHLRATQVALGLVVANVVSGGAVRLTDSGLGCPDWPTCAKRSLTPPLALHPVVEFANRMVVLSLTLAVVFVLAGALLRVPRRRDLSWLSGGLVAGVVGEAVLGGIVVYTKLNPYAVMTHFALGIAVLSVATVLVLRAGRDTGPGRARVPPGARRLGAAMVGVLALAVLAGTATTGAGPHAGGPGAIRLPVPLSDMTRTHSGIVLVLGVLTLLELWLLRRGGAPEQVQELGRLLLAVMVAQGFVGYAQYFSHLPPLLVGIHLAGATAVWCAALWFIDGLYAHGPEPAVAEVPARTTAPTTVPVPATGPASVPAGHEASGSEAEVLSR
jgi:cytochrome c oxidase assembly protein subunit 15